MHRGVFKMYKLYEIHAGIPLWVGQVKSQADLQRFWDKKLASNVFKAVIGGGV